MVTNKLGYNAVKPENVGIILITSHFQNLCPPTLPILDYLY